MQKLTSLRAALLDSGLDLDTKNLTVMAKGGKVTSHYQRPNERGNNKFKMHYDAQVFVMNFVGEVSALAHIINQWLDDNQPNHAPDIIHYELDILDHDTVDVLFTIKGITETITASETTDGTLIGSCKDPLTDPIYRKEGIVELNGDIKQ